MVVANTDDATTGSVTITGNAYDGSVLTADTSALADDGIGTFTYSYGDSNTAALGATGATTQYRTAEHVRMHSNGHNIHRYGDSHRRLRNCSGYDNNRGHLGGHSEPSWDLDGDGLVNSVHPTMTGTVTSGHT